MKWNGNNKIFKGIIMLFSGESFVDSSVNKYWSIWLDITSPHRKIYIHRTKKPRTRMDKNKLNSLRTNREIFITCGNNVIKRACRYATLQILKEICWYVHIVMLMNDLLMTLYSEQQTLNINMFTLRWFFIFRTVNAIPNFWHKKNKE